MKFLIKNENVNATTFRMILFGAINNFVLTTAAAKSIKFKRFMSKQEYQITESIEAFNVRLFKEALELNELYSQEVVSEPMLKEIFISCILEKTGHRYTNTLDSCRNDNLTFQEMVRRLNDKYLDMKSRGNPSHSTNSATSVTGGNFHDQPGMDSVSLASGSTGGSDTSTLPCFQYKRTGKCSFGQRCRYSHNAKVLSEARLPDHANLVMNQLCELQEHCNAVSTARNKFKKNYNNTRMKLQKYKNKFQKPADKTIKDQKQHIEDVIASADSTQPPSSSGLQDGNGQDEDEEIPSENSDLSDEESE